MVRADICALELFDPLESRAMLAGSPLPTLGMLEDPGNGVVRVETRYGDVDIELLGSDAPVAVQSFIGMLRRGELSGTFLHALAAGTTLGGGLFRFTDAHGLSVRSGTAALDQSFARDNVERTVAMLSDVNNPTSSTGEITINLADNSGTANGTWLVFARVIQGWDVVQQIAGLPTADLTGFFPGNPIAGPLTSVPVTQAAPTLMSEDLVVTLDDVQLIKAPGSNGFYAHKLYFPEGYSWERIFEAVELLNPGTVASDYQVLIRYAINGRDQVIATDTLAPDRRETVVVAPGFGRPSTVVRNNEPYAYEVWSTEPLVAGLRHKDFKAGTGETFFRPESLPDEEMMKDWAFTQAALGEGASQAFILWQSIGREAAPVTLTLYFRDAEPMDFTFPLDGHRRGGVNIRELPRIPEQFVGARVRSDQPIVASITRYDQRSGGNHGDEGSLMALGTPGGGALSGLAPGARRGGLDPVVVLNTGTSDAAITFHVLEEGASTPVQRQFTVPAGRVLVLDGSNNPATAAPPGKFYSIRYTSDVPVTVGVTTSAFRGTGTGFATFAANTTSFADARAFTAPAGSPFGQQSVSAFNPNATAATVRIVFRFDDDSSLTTDPFTIGPGASVHRRINNYAPELAHHLNGLSGLGRRPYSVSLVSDIPIVAQATQLNGDGKAELGMTLAQWVMLSSIA